MNSFMDGTWQKNTGPNPANAADGPAGYDYHLYFGFGVRPRPCPSPYSLRCPHDLFACPLQGGPAADEDSYMYAICNMPIVRDDAARGESPLWFGEWSLLTNFGASEAFLYRWADAQKLAFSKGRGWIVRLSPSPLSLLIGRLTVEMEFGRSSGTSRWRSRRRRGSECGTTSAR